MMLFNKLDEVIECKRQISK